MIKRNLKIDGLIANFLFLMAIFIALILLIGDQSVPNVKKIELPDFGEGGAVDLVLEFSDVMDRSSVEKAFSITPVQNISNPVKGQFNWYGKKLSFIPERKFDLGLEYVLRIDKSAKSEDGKFFSGDFVYSFQTPQQDLIYSSYKNGKTSFFRTALNYNLNSDSLDLRPNLAKETKLFDYDGRISKFQVDSNSERIYFLTEEDLPRLIYFDEAKKDLITLADDKFYLNKDFELSDDGKMISLGRIKLSKSGEYETKVLLWIANTNDFQFKQFGDGAQGLDADFSPLAAYILYRNNDSNFELKKIDQFVMDGERTDTMFIGEFSQSFGFHPFQPKMVFTEYDQEDVFSLNNKLVIFSGDGAKDYVDIAPGIFRNVKFSADGKSIYFLYSGANPLDNLTTQDDLVEYRLFHLYKIDLLSMKITQLTNDSDYSELDYEISSDGRFALIKRVIALKENLIDPGFLKFSGAELEFEWWLMNLDDQTLIENEIEADQVDFTFKNEE
jgi:hypothetical protein